MRRTLGTAPTSLTMRTRRPAEAGSRARCGCSARPTSTRSRARCPAVSLALAPAASPAPHLLALPIALGTVRCPGSAQIAATPLPVVRRRGLPGLLHDGGAAAAVGAPLLSRDGDCEVGHGAPPPLSAPLSLSYTRPPSALLEPPRSVLSAVYPVCRCSPPSTASAATTRTCGPSRRPSSTITTFGCC